MITLAIDSTATSASVAIVKDGKVLFCSVEKNGLTHSELLLPMIEKARKETGVQYSDIDLFACTAGPGSFTGVRIGVATIKGLAFGTGRPCVGVSTLESLAENLAYVGEGAILCPMMDARRGQVYNALFTIKDGEIQRLTPDRAIALVDLAEELKQYPNMPIYASGDGYAIGHKTLTELGINLCETKPENVLQNGASIAACAARAYARGEWVNEQDLTPVYLRLPQAERERLEREQANKESK